MLLYTISGAPRGWRVQTALMFKGLSYELKILEASKGEHRNRPYLDLNPRGLVPLLEHEGRYISDSLGIMAWLDRAFPARPLFGETLSECGTIWSAATDMADHMRGAHHDFIFPLLVEREDPGAMSRQALADMSALAARLQAEFQRAETRFRNGPFLFGGNPSAADAVLFPEARLIQRANELVPASMAAFGFDSFAADYPRIDDWMTHISRMPNYQQCLPPHWSQKAA